MAAYGRGAEHPLAWTAGVGKSALVEGLAQRISDGDVPDSLRGCRLMALEMGLLMAGEAWPFAATASMSCYASRNVGSVTSQTGGSEHSLCWHAACADLLQVRHEKA